MKKIFKTAMFAVAVMAAGLGAYKSYNAYQTANTSPEELLLIENVLALSSEHGGSSCYTQSECQNKNGVWNHYSQCVDGGAGSFTCDVSGSLTIGGVTFTGSYKKGHSYNMTWSRFSCTSASGNCCSEQGVFIDD